MLSFSSYPKPLLHSKLVFSCSKLSTETPEQQWVKSVSNKDFRTKTKTKRTKTSERRQLISFMHCFGVSIVDFE